MKNFYLLCISVLLSLNCFSQSVVINKVFNSGVALGAQDAIELIVVGTTNSPTTVANPSSTVSLAGMVIKNYSSNGTVDAGNYTFTNNSLWSNVKSGTIIVLRRGGVGVASTDTDISGATDFNLDINLDDTNYFTLGSVINIISSDMVIIKSSGSSAAGETGAIHAVSFGNTNPTIQFNNVTSPKLRATANLVTAGSFAYVANFNGILGDFTSASPPAGLNVASPPNTDITSGGISLGSPTVLASGNSRNTRFVNILRPTVAIESVYNSGLANGIGDIIKLKVLSASSIDMRGMFIKDFKTDGTASNIYYKFSDATGSIFQSVPSGTVITLTRAASGTSADVNSADFTLDLLLNNTAPAANTEFNSTNTDATNFLDIDENDMLVLQPAADNNLSLTAEVVVTHAMAFGTGFSAGGSRYATIGFGPKVGINDALITDAKISVQNTSAPVNYYNSNLVRTLNTLPVELISFTAKMEKSNVLLKWKTISETNNSYFEILKSSDKSSDVKLARINSIGNSTSLLNYSYTDYLPVKGNNYYKLVQVDKDGTEKLLQIATAYLDFDLQSIKAYIDNSSNISINVFSLKNQKSDVLLTDITGRILTKQNVLLQEGENSFTLEAKQAVLPYILQVKLDNEVLIQKIMK